MPVIESLIPSFDPNTGFIDGKARYILCICTSLKIFSVFTFTETGSLLYTISLLDYVNGSRAYSDLVLTNLNKAWNVGRFNTTWNPVG